MSEMESVRPLESMNVLTEGHGKLPVQFCEQVKNFGVMLALKKRSRTLKTIYILISSFIFTPSSSLMDGPKA